MRRLLWLIRGAYPNRLCYGLLQVVYNVLNVCVISRAFSEQLVCRRVQAVFIARSAADGYIVGAPSHGVPPGIDN